jgi:hypothetical protein
MMRMMLYEAAHIMLVRLAKWSWLKAWAMKIAKHRGMKKAIRGAGASVDCRSGEAMKLAKARTIIADAEDFGDSVCHTVFSVISPSG